MRKISETFGATQGRQDSGRDISHIKRSCRQGKGLVEMHRSHQGSRGKKLYVQHFHLFSFDANLFILKIEKGWNSAQRQRPGTFRR